MANDYDSYTRAVLVAVRPLTSEALADKDDMSAWMGAVLTGWSAPTPKKPKALRRDQDVVVKLFRG